MSFISYLIKGISLGSVYAIIALGYTMVYGKAFFGSPMGSPPLWSTAGAAWPPAGM